MKAPSTSVLVFFFKFKLALAEVCRVSRLLFIDWFTSCIIKETKKSLSRRRLKFVNTYKVIEKFFVLSQKSDSINQRANCFIVNIPLIIPEED